MQETPAIGPTQYGIPAVNMWFLTVESIISTLYKVVFEDSQLKTPLRQTQKILSKVDEINAYISGGKVNKSKMRNQLAEFATFRNTLFHDLTHVKRPSYSHTAFAIRAEKMNQVDLMQAIIIAVNTFIYYRAAIRNIDLMPKIYINAQFEGIDILVKEILFPAFSEILADRKMTTELRLEYSNEELGFELDINAQILVRYEGPTFPAQKPTVPAVVHRFLANAQTSRPIDPVMFRVPDYTSNGRLGK
jgi:hypothetical protein